MVLNLSRSVIRSLVALVVAVAVSQACDSAVAQEFPSYSAGGQTLFYNYYVPGNGGVPAQMYLSPRPTPPYVGHTYITYPPLMPHEYLYRHYRVYRRPDAGRTTTARVLWW